MQVTYLWIHWYVLSLIWFIDKYIVDVKDKNETESKPYIPKSVITTLNGELTIDDVVQLNENDPIVIEMYQHNEHSVRHG